MSYLIRRRMFYEKKKAVFFLSVVDNMAIWSTHKYKGKAKDAPKAEQMIPFYQNSHDKQVEKIIKEEKERDLREHPEYHIESVEDQTKQIMNP